MVVKEAWPSYSCDENEGLGWTAVVKAITPGYAKIHFLYATDPRGLPYADADLTLDVLRPL